VTALWIAAGKANNEVTTRPRPGGRAVESDGGGKLTVAVRDVGLVINGRVVRAVGPDTFVAVGVAGTATG
jgi:hypothetical protein